MSECLIGEQQLDRIRAQVRQLSRVVPGIREVAEELLARARSVSPGFRILEMDLHDNLRILTSVASSAEFAVETLGRAVDHVAKTEKYAEEKMKEAATVPLLRKSLSEEQERSRVLQLQVERLTRQLAGSEEKGAELGGQLQVLRTRCEIMVASQVIG